MNVRAKNLHQSRIRINSGECTSHCFALYRIRIVLDARCKSTAWILHILHLHEATTTSSTRSPDDDLYAYTNVCMFVCSAFVWWLACYASTNTGETPANITCLFLCSNSCCHACDEFIAILFSRNHLSAGNAETMVDRIRKVDSIIRRRGSNISDEPNQTDEREIEIICSLFALPQMQPSDLIGSDLVSESATWCGSSVPIMSHSIRQRIISIISSINLVSFSFAVVFHKVEKITQSTR